MKTTLIVLFLLCAASGFGQMVGTLSSQGVVVQIPDHPQHADQHALAAEQLLVGGPADTYTYAHGERPLWEFGPVSQPTPLGDVARAVRKEKLEARKATVVFEKQGS